MDDGVTSCSFRRNRRKYELRHHVQGDLEKLVGQLDFDAVLAGNLRQLCNFNTAGVDQSIDSSEVALATVTPAGERLVIEHDTAG